MVNITIQTQGITPRSVINKIDGKCCQWRLYQSGQTIRYQKQLRGYFRNRRLTWRETTVLWVRYKKHWSTEKVPWRTSIHFSLKKNYKDTNFAIGGFLAGLHWFPLTLFFVFQDLLATFDNVEDSSAHWSLKHHQLAPSVGNSRIFRVLLSLNSVISFNDKGLKWFEQDQGLPVQALKRVGTLPVILAATVNRRPPCNHLLSNMCSPWLPPWRS